MKQNLIHYVRFYLQSVVNSYSQIFFSLDTWFAVLLLILSLLDIRVGLGGLTAVILTNFIAHILGFSQEKIKTGLYGFNAAFVGMSLLNRFYVTNSFVILFLFAVVLVFMLTIWIETMFHKQKLPVLTLPFVFTLFVVDLAFKSFGNITVIAPFDRYTILLAKQMSVPWYGVAHFLDQFPMPHLLYYYFKTLASVFFTDSILVGVLIAVGLLFHSRIKSTVAFLGFIGAYFSTKALGVDMQTLTQNLGGINYVFWGMAIGSFFIIPNIYSYLLVIGLTPALFLFYSSIENLVSGIGLSSYTLSFSILTILVLFMLKQRSANRFFLFPVIQYYDPEKTVYKNVNYMHRFSSDLLFKLKLPFLGEWTVSQGYDGEITHLGDWSKALDFVITDENSKTYFGDGAHREDYYCYNKPVVAPADGYVYQISNITSDNTISSVNTLKNWGNTIVINHLNGLYTQISHLKKDSFKVKIGDFVTKGTLLASCGNSGRSPEPHVHFQVQLSPEIGSITHLYPIAYFFEKTESQPKLHIGEAPQENMVVFNVDSVKLINNAFDCQPGKILNVTFNNVAYQWQILTNAYNQTYIRCNKTNSSAYVVNDGTMFYFTDFEGKKSSPLYYFYRSCFKILLSSEKDIPIQDQIPLIKEHILGLKWLQDIFAPFFLLTKIDFISKLSEIDNVFYPEKAIFKNEITTISMMKRMKMSEYTVTVTLNKIEITSNKNTLCIVWE